MFATDVIIVGGGIISCSIAYHLAQADVQVTILERGESGGETSGAAAGMLLPLDESPEQGALVNLCLASLRLFRPLADTLHQEPGIDIEYLHSGILRVALSDEEASRLRHLVERTQGLLEWADPEALRILEPRLAPARGAFYFPHLDQVNAGRFTQALAQAAAARGAVGEAGAGADARLRLLTRKEHRFLGGAQLPPPEGQRPPLRRQHGAGGRVPQEHYRKSPRWPAQDGRYPGAQPGLHRGGLHLGRAPVSLARRPAHPGSYPRLGRGEYSERTFPQGRPPCTHHRSN